MPNGMSERSVLIEHCGVGGSARKDTLYPIQGEGQYGQLLSPAASHPRLIKERLFQRK